MYRKSNEVTLKEAIRLLLEEYKLNDRLMEVRLIASWEQVVGSMINRHTKALWIKDKKLYVKVDSAALRMELSFSRSKIMKLLNKAAGRVVIEEVVVK